MEGWMCRGMDRCRRYEWMDRCRRYEWMETDGEGEKDLMGKDGDR